MCYHSDGFTASSSELSPRTPSGGRDPQPPPGPEPPPEGSTAAGSSRSGKQPEAMPPGNKARRFGIARRRSGKQSLGASPRAGKRLRGGAQRAVLSEAELARIRQDHRPVCGCLKVYWGEAAERCAPGTCEYPTCYSCENFASQRNRDWPCDAGRLLMAFDGGGQGAVLATGRRSGKSARMMNFLRREVDQGRSVALVEVCHCDLPCSGDGTHLRLFTPDGLPDGVITARTALFDSVPEPKPAWIPIYEEAL